MNESLLYPRHVRRCLEEALTDTPVVLVHGPRQCGKTTLARAVGESLGYDYITFDDDVQLGAAKADPVGYVARLSDRAVLDEVQRVPELFLALKASVDRDRRPGRFILTGSTNVLLVPNLADSLARRMGMVRLHPLSQSELGRCDSRFLDALFGGGIPNGRYERLGHALGQRIVAGGYPAAIARATSRRRTAWYRDYIETIVQRDVRSMARIGGLDILPRLLQLAAGQTGRLVNVTEMASQFQVARPTARDYVALLERVFLLEHVPPWHSNRLSRLIKTPKLHLCDTGLAAALLGATAESLEGDRSLFGQLLETFVLQELRRQASWNETPVRFFHFRDKEGMEVDIVLERDSGEVAGVEVKSGLTVTSSDFRGLRKLKGALGDRMSTGVVVYDGERVVGFGDNLYAVPIRAIWEACPSHE